MFIQSPTDGFFYNLSTASKVYTQVDSSVWSVKINSGTIVLTGYADEGDANAAMENLVSTIGRIE